MFSLFIPHIMTLALEPAAVEAVPVAKTKAAEAASGTRSTKLVPMINVSASTSGSASIKVAPSVLFYAAPRLDVELAPIFSASTKLGNAEINLSDPTASGPWSAGLGFVFHVLHKNPGNTGQCNSKSKNDVCVVIRESAKKCELALAVSNNECGHDDAEDKNYCSLVEKKTPIDSFDKLCKFGQQHYLSRAPSVENYARAYPLLQIYGGALLGQEAYEFLNVEDDEIKKVKEARVSPRWTIGLISVTGAGFRNFPLTVDFGLAYRTRFQASKTPARWCVNRGEVVIDEMTSAPIESCSESVLGAPSVARTLSASVLLGGTDVVSERWRFTAGPEYTYNLVSGQRSAGLKIPIVFRFTKSTDGINNFGPYKGLIRVTPSFAVDWSPEGDDVGAKVLLTINVLGQQNLFGSLLAGL